MHPEEGYVPNSHLGSKLHQIYGIEIWITLLTILSSLYLFHARPSLLISWISRLFSISIQIKKLGLCTSDNKRFLLEDGIHTLAYGHKDITAKIESIWEGRDLVLMSFDEAKSSGLRTSHPGDPNMIHPRTAKRSIWKRRKVAFEKAKKRIMEEMKGEQAHASKNAGDDISEEELPLKPKPAVTSETSTSLTSIKPSYPFDYEKKTDI